MHCRLTAPLAPSNASLPMQICYPQQADERPSAIGRSTFHSGKTFYLPNTQDLDFLGICSACCSCATDAASILGNEVATGLGRLLIAISGPEHADKSSPLANLWIKLLTVFLLTEFTGRMRKLQHLYGFSFILLE